MTTPIPDDDDDLPPVIAEKLLDIGREHIERYPPIGHLGSNANEEIRPKRE
jgi:hypothetical protein